MTKSQIAASSVGAVVLPIFNFLYGEADAVSAVMAALVLFIVMDWLSGIREAKKDNTHSANMELTGFSERSSCYCCQQVGICWIWFLGFRE
ncbi:hypothetical protein D3C81_927350 [compost metagenome]